MEDDDPHQLQAPRPPRSTVKVARSRNQSEPSWPNTVPVSLEAGGGIPCRPNPAATLLVITPLRRSYVIVAVCLSVSRITYEHVYGCQPNMVGMGKG